MSGVDDPARIDPEDIRETARRFLGDKVERRAAWEGKGSGRASLEAGMAELGWTLLTIPEDLDGLGQDFETLAPLYEELGSALAPVWLAGTMTAIDVLVADGSPAARDAIAAIASEGWQIATILLPPGQTLHSAHLPMVGGADSATHLLVITADGSEARLLLSQCAGVTITPVETWDRGRGYAEVVLEGASTGTGTGIDGAVALTVARAHGELALAWDSVGAASQCLGETVEYMLGRHQFGRPVASFQALKHRAADHKVALELARSLTRHASTVFARRGDGWAVLAAQSRILASETFRAIAEDAVQMYGGVGFTWEYNCHLFLKRALVNELLGGTLDDVRDRIADTVMARALGGDVGEATATT